MTKAPKRKAPDTVSDSVSVATIPGRNGGRLRRGNPGNRGGVGQPPDALRVLLGKSFRERYKIAEKIADNTKAMNKDRLKAVELLHRWAGLDKIGLPEEVLRALASDVRAEVPDEDTITRIHERWKVTLAGYLARHL